MSLLWWGEAPEQPNSIAGSMAVTTLDVMHLCAAEPQASTTPDYLLPPFVVPEDLPSKRPLFWCGDQTGSDRIHHHITTLFFSAFPGTDAVVKPTGLPAQVGIADRSFEQ